MHKITYIISDINKAIAFEWIVDKLNNQEFQLSFILLNPRQSELATFLLARNIPTSHISFQNKRDYPRAFFKVFQILRKSQPDIIHCHLFHANVIGLTCGWILNIRKRIYTRHHSSYNWEYNRKGVRIDKVISWLATDIVAISQNTRDILVTQEKVSSRKIHLIHHGFDLDAFGKVDKSRIESLGSRYNPNKKFPVIGVIARCIEWKGLQYIIPAFKKLLYDYSNAFLILANANGPYKPEVEKLLAGLPDNSYMTIPFENDLFTLYQLFDVYVHTPINPTVEAFGQTYVEALAAGIPSVFTMSGVAPEFVEHERNAWVVDFKDINATHKSILRLLTDKGLSERLKKNGRRDIQRFELGHMISKLEKLYESQVRR